MLTKAPRGTKDVLPQESWKWRFVEQTVADICAAFGYSEVRTPVFEHTELFERGVGLVREGEKFLNDAEQKITRLTQDGEETAFV